MLKLPLTLLFALVSSSFAFSFSTLFDNDDSSASLASDVDLSNGTNIKVRQSPLNAVDWFLMVVIANPETNPISKGGYMKYLYEMVSPIEEKYPNKFKMYTVKADLDLIIHTKVVIVDDVYLSVGSANWNRRSMTSDPELNAEVVDEDTVMSPEGVIVGELPRDFRIRKFVEMTRLSYDELEGMTFIEAANQLALAAADESTILENLEIKHHAYFFAITDTARKISDPQDICTYSSR